VPALCLDLQDRCGADVNVLLYLLFRAAGGAALGADEIGDLDRKVRVWRTEVVQPLRQARRALKAMETQSSAHAELRGAVKRVELESERLEQLALEAAAPRDAARANVAAYLRHLGAEAGDADALLDAFDKMGRVDADTGRPTPKPTPLF
jgi:uncharacterized protein (TIGR02444 family)